MNRNEFSRLRLSEHPESYIGHISAPAKTKNTAVLATESEVLKTFSLKLFTSFLGGRQLGCPLYLGWVISEHTEGQGLYSKPKQLDSHWRKRKG